MAAAKGKEENTQSFNLGQIAFFSPQDFVLFSLTIFFLNYKNFSHKFSGA